jgi:hypothetical protein
MIGGESKIGVFTRLTLARPARRGPRAITYTGIDYLGPVAGTGWG